MIDKEKLTKSLGEKYGGMVARKMDMDLSFNLDDEFRRNCMVSVLDVIFERKPWWMPRFILWEAVKGMFRGLELKGGRK